MAVDPNIKKKADDIRNKIYGKEVRESLASGLEAMSSDVVENEGRQSVVEGRQDSVESQWQSVVDETTDLDVVSAPEIIAARNGESNLKARLDKENQEVTAQLAQKVSQDRNEWFHSLSQRKRHFAHRGVPRISPENTIPSYDKAGQLGGFWGFETDIRLTSDGEFALIHDATVDRTTDGTGTVASMTLAQIRQLNITGVNHVNLYPNTKVPTIQEFLAVCQKYGAVPHIHMKGEYDQLACEKMIENLDEFGLRHKSIISADLPDVQDTFHELDPKIVQFLLLGDITQERIDRAKTFTNGAYYVEKIHLTNQKIKLVKDAGLKLCVATIYQHDYMNYPLMNVDFIVTDNVLEGVI